MIRAVIFDMFETLITHYKSPLYFGSQMAKDAGLTDDEFLPIWRPTEEKRTLGEMTLEDVLELVLRENGRCSPELVQMIADKRTAAKEECFRHLDPQILPLFEALKAKGLKIGLISNCFSDEAKVIRKSELFPYFSGVCLSCELGLQKPDPAIFQECLNQLSVKAEECLYIGDGGSRELETAQLLHMKPLQACWYLLDPAQRRPDFPQLDRPLDLLAFLR